MYIHELPIDINKELCLLLDQDDYWKKLAVEMKYSPIIINEIEHVAKTLGHSRTHRLFRKWSQYNHTVDELFILLFTMKYVPALRCLTPIVDTSLLSNLERNYGRKKKKIKKYDCGNMKIAQRADDSFTSIPVVVKKLGQNSPAAPNEKDMTDEIIWNVASIPNMSYEELQIATDDWNEDNLLGRGGYGHVFKGVWNHLPVAVKRLRDDDRKDKELIREMSLNKYRHDNILPLYGYSFGGPSACLVYQLMAGGSLEQRLRSRAHHPHLTWPQRYRIARGVASGLQFLHNLRDTPLIHADIKPGNILLDQWLTPKIGDFGLAQKGPVKNKTHVKVTRLFGTRQYLPDEYLRSSELSTAVDVFSFGVVLLEMATGLPSLDETRVPPKLSDYIYSLVWHKIDLATLEDPELRYRPDSNPHLCRLLINIGLHCTRPERFERPTMLEVYELFKSMELP